MLKKITRKARHHFASQKKTYTAASLGLFSATFLLLVIFFTTRPIKPFIAELALVEYSILGKTAGSVIPASGESLPETYLRAIERERKPPSRAASPRACSDQPLKSMRATPEVLPIAPPRYSYAQNSRKNISLLMYIVVSSTRKLFPINLGSAKW